MRILNRSRPLLAARKSASLWRRTGQRRWECSLHPGSRSGVLVWAKCAAGDALVVETCNCRPAGTHRSLDAWLHVSVASAALFGHAAGEPELREHAAVGEEGDLGDLAARECDHHQPVRARDVCLRAREVAAEGGLTV